MSACAWCLNNYRAQTCQFPGSDQCRTERRMEDMAHAINASKDLGCRGCAT